VLAILVLGAWGLVLGPSSVREYFRTMNADRDTDTTVRHSHRPGNPNSILDARFVKLSAQINF
jgi:hypothetical protein